jgi:predicted deacylase
MAEAAGSLVFAETEVPAGTRADLELRFARLFTGSWVSLPVAVLNGATPGPRVWLSGTIHGDELNGMEIIRRVLRRLDPKRLAGVIYALPVVNVFGFLNQDRYLPDRRDLNRSFPGSPNGSLAARLAHLFMTEVVSRCDYGLDFHTGSQHRENLPQIRADLGDAETRRLAEAFNAPLMYTSVPSRGMLRAAAVERGARVLVYEGGEPNRLSQEAIEIGQRGVLRVLQALGMWRPKPREIRPEIECFEARLTRWVRAPRSGVFHLDVELGQRVVEGETLGVILGDFLSHRGVAIKAPWDGLVLGFTSHPLVSQGDALVHLARGVEQ